MWFSVKPRSSGPSGSFSACPWRRGTHLFPDMVCFVLKITHLRRPHTWRIDSLFLLAVFALLSSFKSIQVTIEASSSGMKMEIFIFDKASCWFRFPLSLYLDMIQHMRLCICCINTCWLDPSRHVLKQHWPADRRHTASQDQSARAWGGNWSWSLCCLWLCWPPLCHSGSKSEYSSTCTHIHIDIYIYTLIWLKKGWAGAAKPKLHPILTFKRESLHVNWKGVSKTLHLLQRATNGQINYASNELKAMLLMRHESIKCAFLDLSNV